MPQTENVLAFMAVPIFLVAAVANGVSVWKALRARRTGPVMIDTLMLAISLWSAVVYGLIAAGAFEGVDPPLSVILLRPSTLITGILFAVIPGYISTVSENQHAAERVEKALANNEDCQERLRVVEYRLVNQEQAVEIYETAYKATKKELNELKQAYKALLEQKEHDD